MSHDILKPLAPSLRLEAQTICIYGEFGVGKSTFAAGASKPDKPMIFMPFEGNRDSLEHYSVLPKGEVINTFEETRKHFETIKNNVDKIRGVVLDTGDAMYNMIVRGLCAQYKVDVISKIGEWGLGWQLADERFSSVLKAFSELPCLTVILMHKTIADMTDVTESRYEQARPALRESKKNSSSPYLTLGNICSIIAYAKRDIRLSGDKKVKINVGKPWLYTTGTNAWMAKTNLPRNSQMPAKIPLEWHIFEEEFEKTVNGKVTADNDKA